MGIVETKTKAMRTRHFIYSMMAMLAVGLYITYDLGQRTAMPDGMGGYNFTALMGAIFIYLVFMSLDSSIFKEDLKNLSFDSDHTLTIWVTLLRIFLVWVAAALMANHRSNDIEIEIKTASVMEDQVGAIESIIVNGKKYNDNNTLNGERIRKYLKRYGANVRLRESSLAGLECKSVSCLTISEPKIPALKENVLIAPK